MTDKNSTYTSRQLINLNIGDINSKNFIAEEPAKLLYADVIKFDLENSKFYLSIILDSFNSEILAYNLSPILEFKILENTLFNLQINLCDLKGLIIQPSQKNIFLSEDYRFLLFALGAKFASNKFTTDKLNKKLSLTKKFAQVIKTEFFNLYKYDNLNHAMLAVENFIQIYNCKRVQPELNSCTPFEYRQKQFPTIHFHEDYFSRQLNAKAFF